MKIRPKSIETPLNPPPTRFFLATSLVVSKIRSWSIRLWFLVLPVVNPDRHACLSNKPVTISQSKANLASIVSAETGCGSAHAPWRIQVLPGQRINVTLHDFAVTGVRSRDLTSTSLSSPGDSGLPVRTCRMYAVLREPTLTSRVTVCGGERRTKTVYISQLNVLEIQTVVATNPIMNFAFLISFEGNDYIHSDSKLFCKLYDVPVIPRHAKLIDVCPSHHSVQKTLLLAAWIVNVFTRTYRLMDSSPLFRLRVENCVFIRNYSSIHYENFNISSSKELLRRAPNLSAAKVKLFWDEGGEILRKERSAMSKIKTLEIFSVYGPVSLTHASRTALVYHLRRFPSHCILCLCEFGQNGFL